MSKERDLSEDLIVKLSHAGNLLKKLTTYIQDSAEYLCYFHPYEIDQIDLNSAGQLCKDLEQMCKSLELEI